MICLVGAVITCYPDVSAVQKIVIAIVNASVPVIRIFGHIPLLSRFEFMQNLAWLDGIQTTKGAIVASMAALAEVCRRTVNAAQRIGRDIAADHQEIATELLHQIELALGA